MSECSELLDGIVGAQGQFNRAVAEVTRLGELLPGIYDDMRTADGDIIELTNQISAYDAEISGIEEEARRRQIADLDERLRAVDERTAELLFALNGGPDAPPASGESAAVLSAELAELTKAAGLMAEQKALLVAEAIKPELTGEEQAATRAKIAARGEAEALRADVQRFREDLGRREADIKALQDEQFDLQDAAKELEAVLQEESRAAGCDGAEDGPTDPLDGIDEPGTGEHR